MKKNINRIIKGTQIDHRHTIESRYVFCPECGELVICFEVATKYACSSCQWTVSENDKFCWNCGEAFDGFGITRHWCRNDELDREAFTNLAETLKITPFDIRK